MPQSTLKPITQVLRKVLLYFQHQLILKKVIQQQLQQGKLSLKGDLKRPLIVRHLLEPFKMQFLVRAGSGQVEVRRCTLKAGKSTMKMIGYILH